MINMHSQNFRKAKTKEKHFSTKFKKFNQDEI